jgi:2,4-dienoyl-CoA reductase-like NADH-dependent reductase (Old Yellow Enzyme family)
MSRLFSPATFRGLEVANRIVLSPMCMYSAGEDGRPTEWHLVHYGSRAIGRCGLILTEATSVEARGRISMNDLGIWNDDQIEPHARIVRFCHSVGVPIGVQLGHAGRKAWSAEKGQGPETPVGPNAIPFGEGWVTPHELSLGEIDDIVGAFRESARRADQAGYDVIEIHHAHGYLLHQFLSPLSNLRADAYGGSREGRARLLFRVIEAIRSVWPATKPLFLRVSATDWNERGLTPDDFVTLAPALREHGIDVIDASSGGNLPAPPPAAAIGPGYQAHFAGEIRKRGGIATMAVGIITGAAQAEKIIADGQADLVALGRELLRDPFWPIHAAAELKIEIEWPRQYMRGKIVTR